MPAGSKCDIDFIVVAEHPLVQRRKEQLIEVLKVLEPLAPPKGFEMSVVLKEHCQHFVYPTPFELHYSRMHREACQRDMPLFCRNMHGEDEDLAAHFMVIQKVGKTLCGLDKNLLFYNIPESLYEKSIECDIQNAESTIVGENSLHITLNLCRVLAYKRAGVILSKKDGVKWTAQVLPSTYSSLLERAGKAYTGAGEFEVSSEELGEFAAFMMKEIFG